VPPGAAVWVFVLVRAGVRCSARPNGVAACRQLSGAPLEVALELLDPFRLVLERRTETTTSPGSHRGIDSRRA
jgi:hypothetical protein